MAANNERIPLPQRKNGSNKRNRENQTRIIATLKEMFDSTFESDIIISVAQSCNWKLELSIDALINLSSNNEPQEEDEPYIRKYAGVIKELEKDCKNKMEINANESPSNSTSMNSNKVETASLCGLKVEYRPKGMENNSDDDADVVIEEESSDYRIETPEPERVNVCQFLSTLMQCPPTNTFPKVNYINTPSPPCTPQRQPLSSPSMKSKPDPALTRIESDIQKGYKVLVLMRGAPGCGKSYLARSIVTRLANADYKSHIFSTDDYFSLINRGVYTFDASRLSDAHMYNQNAVLNAMRQGWSPIIVDNTNTQAWEMKPYAHMAVEHGYIVDTLEPTTIWFHNVHELEKRNKHNVPKAKIRSMLDRYEPGISGDRLLRMFSFRYLRNNRPPQMRQLPELPAPVPDELDNLEQKMKNVAMKDNTPTPKRIRKPKRTMILDQLEAMSEGLLDNDSLNMITKAYADLDNNSTTTNTNDSKPLANESWTEGSSYKEENLLNMLKLGAIGSERKVAHVVKNAEENVDSQDIIKSEENDETNLLAIECRNSMHELESEQENIKKDDHQSNVMSQCWDFTLLLNGEQIHSRLDVEPSDMINVCWKMIKKNFILWPWR